MTTTNQIRKRHTGLFDFNQRCCHCISSQKEKGVDHNSFECRSRTTNVQCRTCGIRGHNMRFCKYTRCRLCEKRGHIEPDCPRKHRTTTLIQNYINTPRNTNKRSTDETTLTPPPSPKQNKKELIEEPIEEIINWGNQAEGSNTQQVIINNCKNCNEPNAEHKVNGHNYYCDNLCQKIFYRKEELRTKDFNSYKAALNETKAKFTPIIEVFSDWEKVKDVETIVQGRTIWIQQNELEIQEDEDDKDLLTIEEDHKGDLVFIKEK